MRALAVALLARSSCWATPACLGSGLRAKPAGLELLDAQTAREIDRPWPARPRQGSLNGFDLRLAP